MIEKNYNTVIGNLRVKFYDNSDQVLYKLCKLNTLHDNIGYELSDKSYVNKLINLKPLTYREYQVRHFGEPKLQKPKE